MKLDAQIKTIEFIPYNYIRVRGWAHSKYDYSKICGDADEFSLAWFWRNDLPKEIKTVLLDIERDVTLDLQEREIMPKCWPGKLADGIDDGVFTFRLDNFVIQNADWNVAEDKSYVKIAVHSKFHNKGHELISKITLNLSKETNKNLFQILDEHL